jgi:hypothetical protein
MDNVGDYFTAATPLDNYCLSCDRSISPQDLPDVIRLSVQYELPFGHGKPFANRGILAGTVGGWSLGSFFTYDDGAPVSITAPSSGSNTNAFGGGASLRPNVSGISTAVPGGRRIAIGTKTPSEFFNPAAFSALPAFSYGDARRYQSSIRLPGTKNFDMLAEKRIPLPESFALNFRLEAFNIFNRVQLGGLNSSYNTAAQTFGYLTPTQVNSARSMQASLRLAF